MTWCLFKRSYLPLWDFLCHIHFSLQAGSNGLGYKKWEIQQKVWGLYRLASQALTDIFHTNPTFHYYDFDSNPFFALWYPETYTLSHVMFFQALVIPWVRDWTTLKLARNWDGSQDTQTLLIFLDYLSNCCVYLHCWF